MAKNEVLIPFIKSWEGGFSQTPGDKGGATMQGVTLTTFRQAFGMKKTVADLKKMTAEQWAYIYKRYYWDRWQADNIKSQAIANLVVDWLWHSGTWGVKNTQKALGVKADGIVGPKTLVAINNHANEKILFSTLWASRRDYLIRCSSGNQAKFRKGWLNRLNGIRKDCLVCNGGKEIKF